MNPAKWIVLLIFLVVIGAGLVFPASPFIVGTAITLVAVVITFLFVLGVMWLGEHWDD